MAKQIGMTINKGDFMGRVVEPPVIDGGWATLRMLTLVPEKQPDNTWLEVENIIPFITNNPSTIETIKKFVEQDRQLFIMGYLKVWDGGWGVMITTIKLGSKTMYDPEAQDGGKKQQNRNFPG